MFALLLYSTPWNKNLVVRSNGMLSRGLFCSLSGPAAILLTPSPGLPGGQLPNGIIQHSTFSRNTSEDLINGCVSVSLLLKFLFQLPSSAYKIMATDCNNSQLVKVSRLVPIEVSGPWSWNVQRTTLLMNGLIR